MEASPDCTALQDSSLHLRCVATRGKRGVAGQAFTHPRAKRRGRFEPVKGKTITEGAHVVFVSRQNVEERHAAAQIEPAAVTQRQSLPVGGILLVWAKERTIDTGRGDDGQSTRFSQPVAPSAGCASRDMTEQVMRNLVSQRHRERRIIVT